MFLTSFRQSAALELTEKGTSCRVKFTASNWVDRRFDFHLKAEMFKHVLFSCVVSGSG